MKILIIGTGITGCTFARILRDSGFDVSMIEKLNHIGGLCFSEMSPNGILYEPYGARVFHTKNDSVKSFVCRFSEFNDYVHKKGIIIKGKIYPFPINIESINNMPEKEIILEELEELHKKNDDINKDKNFESYMLSQFGSTLYHLFIYNYTKKMWGIEPKKMEKGWVINRLNLEKNISPVHKNEWQGIPKNGYTNFLEKMISGIPYKTGSTSFNENNYDLILYSGRIDEFFKFKFGTLQYKSMNFYYEEDGFWEDNNYGTINLPDHEIFVRKANFSVLYKNYSNKNWVQFQQPVNVTNGQLPMYPMIYKKNIELFEKYLKEICSTDKYIPVGRLGLYKYLNMDKAVKLSMEMIDVVKSWKKISKKMRFDAIKSLLKDY